EKEIDVAGAGKFHACDSRNRCEFRGDLLRDLPRRAAQPRSQLKSHWRGHFAHGHAGRPLRNHGDVLDAAAVKKFAQTRSDPYLNDAIHGSLSEGYSWKR